ncbi:MAG: acetamidase/formamidase family protein [Gaiella sp.]
MRIGPENGHNRWHPDLDPVVHVEPGVSITLDTRDGLDGQLNASSTSIDIAALSIGAAHPLTGPVFVDGAEPGDLLAIEILDIGTPTYGVNCIIPGFGFLADLFTDPFVVHWELDGAYARSSTLPGIAVRAVPHPGVIGVAPSHVLMAAQREREAAILAAGGPVAPPLEDGAYPAVAALGLRTVPPRENGGNVDIRRLVPGSTLYLAVHVPGALFSLGDVHFAQGDGEVCGTGIEIDASVTVSFHVQKGAGGTTRFPSYRTPARPGRERFATTGIPEHDPLDLTVAARNALLAMIDWLVREHGFSREAAYCLCSACVDLTLSQVVDIPYPLVSALCPLDIFEGASS